MLIFRDVERSYGQSPNSMSFDMFVSTNSLMLKFIKCSHKEQQHNSTQDTEGSEREREGGREGMGENTDVDIETDVEEGEGGGWRNGNTVVEREMGTARERERERESLGTTRGSPIPTSDMYGLSSYFRFPVF